MVGQGSVLGGVASFLACTLRINSVFKTDHENEFCRHRVRSTAGEELRLLICRLCDNSLLEMIHEDKMRSFFLCSDCAMISVPQQYWVDEDQERRRYDLHDNTLSNSGYVKYLSQMVIETEKLKLSDPLILDFGSGPNAVLASLLKKKEYRAEAYDPLFGLEFQKEKKYDLVIMCEVIEHLRDIRKELKLVRSVLQPGGKLLLRTQLYPSLGDFSNWWYAMDPTHINFFSGSSLGTVASILEMRLAGTVVKDIFIFSDEK